MERSLGQAIRRRRGELGLTQEELAERALELGDESIRQSDISRIELGQVQMPRMQRLEILAEALEMEFSELLVSAGWLDSERDQQRQVEAEPSVPEPDQTFGQVREVRNRAVHLAYEHFVEVLSASHERERDFRARKAKFEKLVKQFEQARAEFEQEHGKDGPSLFT